jgi:malic enzyme
MTFTPIRTNFRPQVDPETGERYLPLAARGQELLSTPLLNKGTAFTREEREAFDLVGMLPDRVSSIEEQMLRVRQQFDHKPTDMEKNIHLNALMDRNETLFYRFLLENLTEMVPIVYTPTVASACRHWSAIFRRGRGIYLTPRDRGNMVEVMRNHAPAERPVIVVTDNERILGIGDQGAGGMGIPIGKLALYTAAAGIQPCRCIPISLDVGTTNEELLNDPVYIGYREPRLRGDEYDDFIAEFVDAVLEVFPGALLQWEDFANRTSFRNLELYRDHIASFNDDIQGTAAMVVAGLMAATSFHGGRMRDHRVVIAGSGSAGVGIRHQLVTAMVAEGADRGDAERRIFVLDSTGLVVDDRPDLPAHKRGLAVPRDAVAGWDIRHPDIDLVDVVRNVATTVLIGVSGTPGLFTEEIVRQVAAGTERPIIMALSNPTSKTEVLPANALAWTDGRAVVATGSPFAPVDLDGITHCIGQANNVVVFPGIGLAALVSGARRISDEMFLAASKALAALVDHECLSVGQIYPPISRMREVSKSVAMAVAQEAISSGLADPIDDLEAEIEAAMWYPDYVAYRPV